MCGIVKGNTGEIPESPYSPKIKTVLGIEDMYFRGSKWWERNIQ